MTERVDFYILQSAAPKQRWAFACRLTEKAYLRDLTVVVLNDTVADTQIMDELLWTFNERSFVPHAIHSDTEPRGTASPVRLTPALESIGPADLLVNLSGRMPTGMERFARIAEVVDADEERRRLGRERYKAYRELKVPLETHQLDAAAEA